jgi:hypothetical protein
MIRYLNAASQFSSDETAWKRASAAAWKRGEGLTQKGNVPGSDEPLATDENGDPIVFQGAGYPFGYIMSGNGKRRIPLDAEGLPVGRWRRTLNSIGKLFKDTGEAVDNLGGDIKGAIAGRISGSGGGDVEAAQAQGEASNA